jgi:hypothetical protein
MFGMLSHMFGMLSHMFGDAKPLLGQHGNILAQHPSPGSDASPLCTFMSLVLTNASVAVSIPDPTAGCIDFGERAQCQALQFSPLKVNFLSLH